MEAKISFGWILFNLSYPRPHRSMVPGVKVISAGNYGGKLGKFHFHLRHILGAA